MRGTTGRKRIKKKKKRLVCLNDMSGREVIGTVAQLGSKITNLAKMHH